MVAGSSVPRIDWTTKNKIANKPTQCEQSFSSCLGNFVILDIESMKKAFLAATTSKGCQYDSKKALMAGFKAAPAFGYVANCFATLRQTKVAAFVRIDGIWKIEINSGSCTTLDISKCSALG